MILFAVLAVSLGLVLLVFSAGRFVDGAVAAAQYLGVPSLLVGMVVVGFGTSAPEMIISALSAWQGNPGLALGNAYGSNIANIALILGLTAVFRPIRVRSSVLRTELPLLLAATVIGAWQLRDGNISRLDALLLLGAFGGIMGWSIWKGIRNHNEVWAGETERKPDARFVPIHKAVVWLVCGLMLLVVSSRILVWGAVDIARAFGVSDLIIGLTIIAVGTSLPELAASVLAARKGEQDLILGNVLGSNLFNTLAVVGIAGVIRPIAVEPEALWRDVPVMVALTASLFVFGYGFRRSGSVKRFGGTLLVVCYITYTSYLVIEAFNA